jgi:hypothetical protein
MRYRNEEANCTEASFQLVFPAPTLVGYCACLEGGGAMTNLPIHIMSVVSIETVANTHTTISMVVPPLEKSFNFQRILF